MKLQGAAKPRRLGVTLPAVFVALVGACALSCARPPAQVSPSAPAEPTKRAQPAPRPSPLSHYDLTAGSVRLVRSLKGPLQIDVYVTRGLPRLKQITSDVAEMLTAYEQQSEGKLKFRLIEVDSAELRERANKEGLVEQPVSEAGETDPDAHGYLGLVFRYGNQKAAIPVLPPDSADGLEFWITNKIREIRDEADGIKHRIGVVAGKNELKLSDTNLVPKQAAKAPSIQGIIEQAFPFYRIEPVDLKRGASAIDPELAGLIITQPQEDYVEPELRRIDEFLMRGGKSLVVFASAVNLKPNDPKLQAKLSTRGLEPLLDGYGIHLNKDAVFDHSAQFRVQIRSPSGEPPSWLRHPGIALVVSDPALGPERRLLDNGFAPFFRMTEVIFPFASSLQLMPDKQPSDVVLRVVARSTPATMVETSAQVDMKLRDHWTPKPPLAQRALAACAQGKLQSAFAGAALREARVPKRAPTASRVLVISSSLFITNPFAYAGNDAGSGSGDPLLLSMAQPYTKYLTSTILVMKNAFDWMIGDEDLIAVSAKLDTASKR